jgi:hypothetical protein
VPRLRLQTAEEAEVAWQHVKSLKDPVAQAKDVAKGKLDRTVCRDLTDFRALPAALTAGFSYRDWVRGRSWMRPAVANVLVRAMARLREAYPGATLTVGDASQPGCGPVTHGTLVHHLAGPAALAVLSHATLEAGLPVAVEAKTATDFPAELDRFWTPENLVRVEHRVLGQLGVWGEAGWAIRVATRRYLRPGSQTPEEWTKEYGRVARLVQRGRMVSAERARSWDPELGLHEVWAQRFVDATSGRQALVLSSKKLARRLLPEALLSVRLGGWQPEKPESFRREDLWRPHLEADGTPVWERWQLMHEAGHQTHIAGRDVDLSFVTAQNQNHFAVDLAAMDVAATWRWFEALVEAGEALGTPVDRILVDRKVKRHLEQNLGKAALRSPVWRRLVVVSGHDAHHHLRIAIDSPERDRRALAALGQ